eukprot:SAG22_NODE_1478_length_4327_cov_3.241249_3_plen_241_part_00
MVGAEEPLQVLVPFAARLSYETQRRGLARTTEGRVIEGDSSASSRCDFAPMWSGFSHSFACINAQCDGGGSSHYESKTGRHFEEAVCAHLNLHHFVPPQVRIPANPRFTSAAARFVDKVLAAEWDRRIAGIRPIRPVRHIDGPFVCVRHVLCGTIPAEFELVTSLLDRLDIKGSRDVQQRGSRPPDTLAHIGSPAPPKLFLSRVAFRDPWAQTARQEPGRMSSVCSARRRQLEKKKGLHK